MFDYTGMMARPTPARNIQRSFDDLGQPLHEVTFCVIDLETTGGSPSTCGITEIGAVKLRGGECVGTFQTLVNPGMAVPPEITVLTGITTAMVVPAPRIEAVLPALLEFIGDAVLVGHNVRFDTGFLDAALTRSGRARLANRRVDTVALARRLLRDEVPNCRLGTLAERLRLPHRPSHRALDDALATGDLLHLLIERVGRLGVTGLDDLLSLPKLAGHPQVAKLALTDSLPRAPGVYLFRDVNGQVLYVGKASNLRQRVRSYFSGDHRRKVPQMLRETHRIDHRRCVNDLEAAVSEIRLIQVHQPRFNSQLKRWKRYTYLKLTTERFPRLSITKQVRDDAAIYLGPLSSTAAARQVAEAIETAVPIRRCTARPGANPRSAPCAAAQLGVATCPCAGAVTESEYAPLVDRVVAGITSEPALLLEPLATKMHELARAERYEEAADMRDRAAALASALERRRSVERLRSTGHLLIELADGGVALRDGHFLAAWSGPPPPDPLPGLEPALPPAQLDGPRTVPGRDEIDELLAVARWLDANTARIRIVGGDLTVTELPEPLPRFRPTGTTLSATSRHH
ncbi:MAG: DEDD exonuclease domain-containing protein [Acidimicrobiales bacterium]